MKKKNNILHVQNIPVAIVSDKSDDFISLTDIAKYRNSTEPFSVINNWMRNRASIALDYGKSFTIQILNLSNSRGLKPRQGVTTLSFLPRDGLKLPMQSELFPNQADTVEPSRIRILHLNLLLGLVQNSNST